MIKCLGYGGSIEVGIGVMTLGVVVIGTSVIGVAAAG